MIIRHGIIMNLEAIDTRSTAGRLRREGSVNADGGGFVVIAGMDSGGGAPAGN
jgi:hypothetical protein